MRSTGSLESWGAVFGLGCLALMARLPASPARAGENVAGVPSRDVTVRLPADLIYDATVPREQAVTFRHSTHVPLSEGSCVACHPEPFRILRPVRKTSHDEMNSGGSCGRCHDGKSAFSTKDEKSCDSCHAGSAQAAVADASSATGSPALPAGAAAPGPKDATFRTSPDSPGPVVFRHATHRAGPCARCHPGIFAMKIGGTKVGSPADLHGKCGTCHGGGKTFGIDDPDFCSRCHAAEGDKR